jgi:hypothetical protein
VNAVSVRCGWDGVGVFAAATVVVIDFMINAAFEATQTHTDCLLALLALTARGWKPTTIRTTRMVTKIAKRRIGLPPEGGYGSGVIKFLKPRNGIGTSGAKLL